MNGGGFLRLLVCLIKKDVTPMIAMGVMLAALAAGPADGPEPKSCTALRLRRCVQNSV